MVLIDMDRLRKELMAKGDIPIHEVFNTIWDQPIVNVSQQKWIPVSERLPEDFGGDYLVNIEYKGGHEGTDIATYCIGGYLDGLWDTPNDWIEGPSELWHVTAWMPLPQPYVPDTNVGEMGESEDRNDDT